MNTSEFAQTLLHRIKESLSWLGIPWHILDQLEEALCLVLRLCCYRSYLGRAFYPEDIGT